MNFPKLRTAGLHIASVAGGAIAAITFMSSHAVDLYAIYDQLNAVVKSIQTLLALVVPFATTTYAVYLRNTSKVIEDTKAADPAVKAVITTNDAAGVALASKLPNDNTVVPAGTAQAVAVATS